MSNVAIVGAGKTGRGFLARLLRETPTEVGEIVFVDKNRELVDKLNQDGFYSIHFFGESRIPMRISGYRAFTWDDKGLEKALDTCRTVLVSVGGQNLTEAGHSLKDHLKKTGYTIITAENASHPAATLQKELGNHYPISEGTVFCTTIERDGLNISSEDYPYFQFDADAVPGYMPESGHLRPVKGFADFLTRKLYTYNAASCVIAYLGAVKGYSDYGEAANDPEIVEKLDRNYAATNKVLCKEYGYDEEDQAEFALLSRKKFLDRTITDTVARNARDPQRKLAAGERIMGPLMLIRKYGGDSSVLEETAAAALLYEDPSDPVWTKLKEDQGPEGILREVCGLKETDGAWKAIILLKAKMQGR